MTIRRDIDLLEDRGVARKVLGGAIAPAGLASEPTFATRSSLAASEKVHIAAAVVDALRRHETVILDSGSTVLAVARTIRGRDLALTVITPSLLVALELVDEPDTTVFLAGGLVRPGELSLIGSDAEGMFSRYNADTFVMGVAGVDVERGVTDYHPGEGAVKQAAMAAADRTIVAIDHSKLGKTELMHIAPLSRLHAIVTDGVEDHPALVACRRAGVTVTCVPVASIATRAEVLP